jgi:uncharacterized protein (TIGR02246 family)
MLPNQPEAWPLLFEHHLEARNLDAAAALYEPDARFVAASGEIVAGRDRIREVLAHLIGTNTHMRGRVVQAVVIDNIAVLYTDFEGTALDASGAKVPIRSRAIEVLRQQPDGTWKLIVGDPNGRAAHA